MKTDRAYLTTVYTPLLIICLFYMACKSNLENPLEAFTDFQEVSIPGEKIRFSSDTILFKPYNFAIADTIAVFNDNTGEAGYTLINLRTGEFIKKLAFSGTDSSQFDINGLDINKLANTPSKFTITQINTPNKVVVYSWDSLLSMPGYRPKPFYYPEGFGFRNSILLNDSILFGRFFFSQFDNKMFGVVNTKANRLITGVEVPGVNDNSVSRKYEDSAYFKWMNQMLNDAFIYRPNSKYEFANFSFRGAVIQIFNVDSNYQFHMKYEKIYHLPTFHLVDNGQVLKPKVDPDLTKHGFSSIAATHDNIYALFNGPLLNGSEENESVSDLILVYDWNGKPIGKIKLDQKCRRIYIDTDNPSILYASYGDSNAELMKYKLAKE